MAAPMSADRFLAVLEAEGVTVAEHPGWRSHNRAGHGPWGPVNGVVIHHTGGGAPGDAGVVWGGRADLPGPLAHCYLAKSGVVTMTGNGRTNHAGGGDPAVLAAVVGDDYGSRPPATRFHEGSPGATDGNAHFYGLEISNWGDGEDPYPAAQRQAAVRWAAAVCRHHGWSEKSVIAHAEWSDRKNDPSFDIVRFRDEVKARLAIHPGTTPVPKPPVPKPPVPKAPVPKPPAPQKPAPKEPTSRKPAWDALRVPKGGVTGRTAAPHPPSAGGGAGPRPGSGGGPGRAG
ncbi:peptidoglycan recognition protein family protein [Actinacidiphila paucisporea]|uniref:N-acetylmuramoyl-L-alanine amidase n=1 Tax=Actinacidiphila paucisporea TaxID=310782 RepID=A0A1M6WMR2_9ACTN|nr:N-acetylmuramoyl-L-alanine amidase [Actinacidiphila paucisporea]SHK94874.1 N-acetylmuramoyl-L-alanine amidase [Actinacidiphila paucisporea]